MSGEQLDMDIKTDSQADLIETYKRVFATKDGQKVLFNLMHEGFFIRPTMESGYETSLRNEGRRELILYIIELLNRDSAEIYEFIKKHEDERKREMGDYELD